MGFRGFRFLYGGLGFKALGSGLQACWAWRSTPPDIQFRVPFFLRVHGGPSCNYSLLENPPKRIKHIFSLVLVRSHRPTSFSSRDVREGFFH